MKKLISSNQEFKRFFGREPLIAASIRLTKGCNLHCPHCYANGGMPMSNEMGTSEIKNVVNQLKELGVLHIFFTGGEPLLKKDLVKILEYTDKIGLGILLSTNGQLVNEKFLKAISKLNIKLFQFSLDGNKETHEAIRGKGTWAKAVSEIKLARKYIRKNVAVGTVLMKNNWNQLDKILETAKENGADTYALMFLIMSGRANSRLDVSAKKYLKALKKLFKKYKTIQDKIKFATNTTIPAALVPKEWREQGLEKKFAMCSFPYCLGVEANGDVAPCDGFFNYPEMLLGNINKDSIESIWKKSKILKEIRAIKPNDLKGVCSKCIYKEYCAGGCRASAYGMYKDLKMPDPVCQKIYEAGLFPKDCLIDENTKD